MIINVVRGYSLVLHDPEGSHYRIRRWKVCNFVRDMRLPRPDLSGLAMTTPPLSLRGTVVPNARL
jgi:hypothetical protein